MGCGCEGEVGWQVEGEKGVGVVVSREDGGVERVRGRYVVGADGSHRSIR